MPIYEYRCRSCETRFEKLVSRTADEVACPACEGQSLEKLLSAFAVVSGGHHRRPPEGCPASTCGESRCCGSGCAAAD